jgi:SagB-type dehydrogenase family enzyme
VRDVRPPLTELSPLPEGAVPADLPEPAPDLARRGATLKSVLRKRRSCADFVRAPLSLDDLWTINRLAFRGGTFAPVFPAGPHVGLVRPFWAVHDVTGMPGGIWHYDPIDDRWHSIKPGEFRIETQYVSLEQRLCGNASAACFIMSDLPTLMQKAGPDVYRLAHLEAGIVGQRIHLASAALGLGCSGIGAFYDDEVRAFLELEHTGWETIFELVVGVTASPVTV